MKDTIKDRIAQVRRGKVPEGYIARHGYCFPIAWHTEKLRDAFSRLTTKNPEKCENVLTISAQQGLISQRDYYIHSYASENTQGYYFLKKGDYAYNKSYSDGYPFGAIKRLDRYEQGIVSPLYICFSPNINTNSDYYNHYFGAGVFNREIYSIAQEGARNHGLLNVAVDNFFDGYILCPPIAEQQKIAEILSQCDKVISLKQELLEEKRKQKKWLMQRLLNPNSGMRLPTFKGNWKRDKFKTRCLFINGRAYAQDELSESGKYRVLRVGNLFTNSNWYYSSLELPPEKYCAKNDLIYAWSASFGPFIWTDEKVIFHYHIWKVIPFENTNKNFLYYCLLYDVDILSKEQQGGIMSHITKEAMENRMSWYPPTKDEQVAVANVLSTSDKEINLLEQELAAWKEKKKGLAQLLLTGLVQV